MAAPACSRQWMRKSRWADGTARSEVAWSRA
ncbi:hypothetical protein H4W80_006539 [Nonomuraea angiospora]|uniref:Uncharacterized protein n=1 Tax=Nonomuraea angiospora TaxID=46172 RepID=A0ABR9M7I1_9ACTN|nr:hypothetical protein [Nonomuraea angiospora]